MLSSELAKLRLWQLPIIEVTTDSVDWVVSASNSHTDCSDWRLVAYNIIPNLNFFIKSTLNSHLDQMLHENVQAHIFSKEVAWFYRGILVAQTAWVDSHFNLPFICVARCAYEESRHWEPLSHYILRVLYWHLQEWLQVGVVGLLVIACFFPVSNFLTLPDAYIKEGV